MTRIKVYSAVGMACGLCFCFSVDPPFSLRDQPTQGRTPNHNIFLPSRAVRPFRNHVKGTSKINVRQRGRNTHFRSPVKYFEVPLKGTSKKILDSVGGIPTFELFELSYPVWLL